MTFIDVSIGLSDSARADIMAFQSDINASALKMARE